MKKIAAVVSLALSIPAMAESAEFLTPGALGMGGAGVARNNGALTAYWNPAGGAFKTTPFAMSIGVEAGIRGSEGLAENVDRLSKITFNSMKDFNTSSSNPNQVGDLVKTFSILNDIGTRQGNLAISGMVPVCFASKRFSFGVFGNMEGYIQPKADMQYILPNTTAIGTPVLTIQDLYNAVATDTSGYSGYFSATQFDALNAQIKPKLIDPTTSDKLVYAIENQMKNSGIPASTVFTALNDIALPTLADGGDGGTKTLNKNTTSVMTKAIQYMEAPISYGHPINLGKNSKLGIGVTAKLISGTVYQNQVLLVNRSTANLKSGDLVNEITKNKKTSSSFGVDLGAMYKYHNWLSLGIVGKNLNSPKFDAPDYFSPVYNGSTNKVELTQKVTGGTVELKPQIRAGAAFEPAGWLTVATDLDLRENDTISPGSIVGNSFKSRNFGGGVEFKPASWLKVRGGAYKNLASSRKQVLTAGFKLLLLDVDGAFATDSFVVDGTTLPQEFLVNAGMSFSF